MGEQHDHNDHLEKRRLDRMLFFTDAVFAIVLTLLVLELKPPAGATPAAALEALTGPFVAFLLSFAIVAIFWVAHLATTQRLLRFDWPVTVVNLVFLLPICLVPFVSAWIGGALTGTDGWKLYDLVLIACSLSNAALVFTQTRGGGRLMAGGVTPRERIYRLARAISPGLAFGVGLIGAIQGHVGYSQFAWVLIPVFFAACRLFLKPKVSRLTA